MQCTICFKEQDLENFGFRNKSKQLRHSKCKQCQRAYTKKHYQENKDTYKSLAKTNRKQYLTNGRLFIDKLKAVPCFDCNKIYPPWVMQFDHLYDKEYQLSKMCSYSKEMILQEAAKCQVVCANCHAIRTHNRLINFESAVSPLD
jgi:hypothetical protein